ncbi:hypothetical protein F5Y17DRAFT_433242 [Xylariaceae sp. FL0594]|nr:hypothetical protein F5Y17DRAFT_433242 [Xylariaceae sp. FL0594]
MRDAIKAHQCLKSRYPPVSRYHARMPVADIVRRIIRRENCFRAMLVVSRGAAPNTCTSARGSSRPFQHCIAFQGFQQNACASCIWRAHTRRCTYGASVQSYKFSSECCQRQNWESRHHIYRSRLRSEAHGNWCKQPICPTHHPIPTEAFTQNEAVSFRL